MEADLKLQWSFSFTPEQLLLICKGLRGVLSENEEQQAKDLDTEIARLRVSLIKNRLGAAQKLERNLDDAKTTEG